MSCERGSLLRLFILFPLKMSKEEGRIWNIYMFHPYGSYSVSGGNGKGC